MRLSKSKWIALMLLHALTVGTGSCQKKAEPEGTPVYSYRIVNRYPHRREAFTQGLVFHDGYLYEGTGGEGTSNLSKVDLATGAVLKQVSLPDHLFGEGITLFGNLIYQLTWKGHLGYRFDRETFEPRERFKYRTEGWGLTHDGTHLIMSDGTHRLTWRDPNTFAVQRSLKVQDQGHTVKRLNELEWVVDRLYANVWMTPLIAIIDPESGQVNAWLDLGGLKARHRDGGVLNGIAYDAEHRRLFVTGKLWSTLYEIEVLETETH